MNYVLMIHVLNNLPEEYDVILDGLENDLIKTSLDALMIEVNWYTLVYWYWYEKRQKKKHW